ncbi:MAG: hypothetical protein C7B46_12400 [Sulfobacillus benefaciens]|uniref:Uncharacterized protein n=1 Tax=Sulfobacillus benefaciens TaxID=453960 RepID=A0A2T2XEF5_9FIRM|nr:MAG: hypothetical protein C7B46_12400 [Sulfobacillus benefaciens]
MGRGEDNIEEFSAALQGPDAIRADLTQRAQELTHLDLPILLDNMSPLLSPVDQRTLTGDFGAYLLESFSTVKTHGIEGWLDDDLAFVKPWGFDVLAISDSGADMARKTKDQFVPFSHGQWLGQHIVIGECANGKTASADHQGAKDSVDWPHLGQAFRIDCHTTDLDGGNPRDEVTVGITPHPGSGRDDRGPEGIVASRPDQVSFSAVTNQLAINATTAAIKNG